MCHVSHGYCLELVSAACHVSQVVECCFTSTETIRLIRGRDPRTATSTFTHLLGSVVSKGCCLELVSAACHVSHDDDELMLNVLRCHLTY